MNMEQGPLQQKNAEDLSAERSSFSMEEYLSQVAKKSKFTVEPTENGEVLISSEGEKFNMERISDPEDDRVSKLVNFVSEFDPKEAITPEIIKKELEDELRIYTIIENDQKEIASFTQGNYLEIKPNKEGEKAKEAIVFLGYTITSEDHKRKGFALESNRKTIEIASKLAEARQQTLKAIVVEAVEESEPLGNQLGLKRAYYKGNDGNYFEVPYVQPPIQWDSETGAPLDYETGKVGEKPLEQYCIEEHLMLKMTDGKQELSSPELIDIIRATYAIYIHTNSHLADEFNKEAMKKMRKSVADIADGIQNKLSAAEDGKITLLDKNERLGLIKKLGAEGKELAEITKIETD